MSISKKISNIKKYKDIIKSAEIELFNDIKNLMLQTNFVEVKKTNGKKDFIYIMDFPNIENKWFITGIKNDNKKDIEIGIINIEYIKECENIKSIEPYIFFNNIKKQNINWYINDITQECLKYKHIENFNQETNCLQSVGYCRLSQKSNYDRQKYNISSKSNIDGYIVKKIFCETLSGDTPFNKRKEILSLIEYCSTYNIHKIYVSEFNRLGRNTKTILDGISFLRKNGIKIIHIILENITIDEEYIKNNYKTLKSLCRKAEEDRENIINRLQMGLASHKEKLKMGMDVKPLGRKIGFRQDDKYYKEKYYKDIELLLSGTPQRQISTITGTSLSTIKRLNKRFKCNCKNT
jgi:DNA invertase Pin-like site-specific DNA recombinase